jgi:hypothetical protein
MVFGSSGIAVRHELAMPTRQMVDRMSAIFMGLDG